MRRSRWLRARPPAIPAIPAPAASAGVFSRFAVSAIALPAVCAFSTAVSLACSTVLLPADGLERRLLDEPEGPPLGERRLVELLVALLPRLDVLPLRERAPLAFDFGFAVERPFEDVRGFERALLELRLVC